MGAGQEEDEMIGRGRDLPIIMQNNSRRRELFCGGDGGIILPMAAEALTLGALIIRADNYYRLLLFSALLCNPRAPAGNIIIHWTSSAGVAGVAGARRKHVRSVQENNQSFVGA